MSEIYANSGEILAKLLVIALVLESAFTTIFDWRVFRAYFSRRGVKTIVMVISSWLVVWKFNFDAVGQLFELYSQNGVPLETSGLSSFLTALVLAGGSAGINRLLQNIGVRAPPIEQVQRPRQDQAWVAVRVKRSRAVGQIFVHIGEVKQPSGNLLPLAGTVGGRLPTLFELLFRNPSRFPSNGGYTLDPNKHYEIVVEGKDASGERVSGIKDVYVFAPGAVVDFDVTL